MTYADLFYEIKGKFMGADVSDIHEHLAFQFNIEDEEAGGAFYVEVKDGVLHVEPYEYYDRDAMFICSSEVLLKIADGEMDPIAAFTDQKLRVEGNIEKALRLKEIIELKKGAAQEKSIAKKAADKVVNTVVKTAVKKAAAKEAKINKTDTWEQQKKDGETIGSIEKHCSCSGNPGCGRNRGNRIFL